MENISLLEVVLGELSLLAIFLVIMSAYFDRNRDDLFLTIIASLIIGPVMYFYIINALTEQYFEKEKTINREDVLIMMAFLLFILLILSIIEINDLFCKVYIAILLVSVLQIYFTIKFQY